MRLLPNPPHFLTYDGGDQFIYHDKIFYRLKKIGAGSYGDVFLFHSDNKETVAVKCEIGKRDHYDAGISFSNEAWWYRKVYGLGVLSGDPTNWIHAHYILMPYFAGDTLYNQHESSFKKIILYWIWTATALLNFHNKHGAIHGDIKTNNIIINSGAELIDFGFATPVNQLRKDHYFTTEKSQYYYQSPELFSDRSEKRRADTKQDIFSLGVLLQDSLNLFFRQKNYSESLSIETKEKIDEITRHLTQKTPAKRWSIAKAIFMADLAILSHVPYQSFNSLSQKISIGDNENVDTLSNIHRFVCIAAIQMRLYILACEQKQLIVDDKKSKNKELKLKLLTQFLNDIRNESKPVLPSIQAAKKNKLLISGFFSHRTKDMMDELEALMVGMENSLVSNEKKRETKPM